MCGDDPHKKITVIMFYLHRFFHSDTSNVREMTIWDVWVTNVNLHCPVREPRKRSNLKISTLFFDFFTQLWYTSIVRFSDLNLTRVVQPTFLIRSTDQKCGNTPALFKPYLHGNVQVLQQHLICTRVKV